MSHAKLLLTVLVGLAVAVGGLCDASPQVHAQDSNGTPVVDLNETPPVGPDGTLPGNPQIQLVKVAEGLADPINVAAQADGSGRLFIVERVGRIRVLDKGGNVLPDPFLDLTELVQNDYLEQGLLGLAFHPDYATNGRFYVDFTDYHTNGDTFVMEFHVSRDNPNVADRESGKLLLPIDQRYVNHNGGSIHFGPDGFLYIGTGDGGMGGDPTTTRRIGLLCWARCCASTSTAAEATPMASRRTTRMRPHGWCSQTPLRTSSARQRA